ncbi:MAG: peptidylprolyl isomerase [Holophagales bacterium]|nr:peptidylprolyl isomerase [Holophagales bacterium]
MKARNRIFAIAAIALAATFFACQREGEKADSVDVQPPQAEAAQVAVADQVPYSTMIRVKTSMGDITIELLPDAAPKTVANFQKLVREGFFDGLIFHRVIPDFMIQSGGHTPDMGKKASKVIGANEADVAKSRGLLNTRGTISMAYVPGDPFGASSQFFINVKHNKNLDFKEKSLMDYGHCPFGKVVAGMDVVDKISKVQTKKINEYADVPVQPVLILKAEEIKK